MRALHRALLIKNRKCLFALRDDERHPGCHARVTLFDVEMFAALPAPLILPRFDGDRLHRHHGTRYDRSPVTAAPHLARTVFGPEDVDDLGASVAVGAAFLEREGKRVKTCSHDLAARDMSPRALVAARAVARIERHDARLHVRLTIGEQ